MILPFAGAVEVNKRSGRLGEHGREFFAFTVTRKVEYDVKEIRYV